MFLLDTNVVSELRKIRAGRADANVAQWADSVDAIGLYLSAITVQELEMGVLQAERRDPPQGAILRTNQGKRRLEAVRLSAELEPKPTHQPPKASSIAEKISSHMSIRS